MPSMSDGSAPSSSSFMHRPMVCVPGASRQAFDPWVDVALADPLQPIVGAQDDDEAVLGGAGVVRVVVGGEENVALDRVDPHTGAALTSFQMAVCATLATAPVC